VKSVEWLRLDKQDISAGRETHIPGIGRSKSASEILARMEALTGAWWKRVSGAKAVPLLSLPPGRPHPGWTRRPQPAPPARRGGMSLVMPGQACEGMSVFIRSVWVNFWFSTVALSSHTRRVATTLG
jgi:hypothetical protein